VADCRARRVRIAPFQVLATDRSSWQHHPHDWHLGIADRLVAAEPDLIQPTARMIVHTDSPESVANGAAWWHELTDPAARGWWSSRWPT
jgi:protein phosphatase